MVTLTQEQLESMRKAIRTISNRTHITISELNTYLIAGKMPDNVYNALIQAFGVKDIKDVSTSRVAMTVNKVSSIYEAIITAKEAEQKPQMHTLTEDQKKGVETSIENLNHYLTELQLLRAEVERKSKSATGVDKQNYAEQKSSLTRSIKATVKAKAILQHVSLNGEAAEDIYNWLFVASARKGAKLEQLDDAFNQFVEAGDKTALPTGNAAHKLVKEFNRMAEKGLISASPKKPAPQPTPKPAPQQQPTPNDGVKPQPQKPTTGDDGDNGASARPVETGTPSAQEQKPQETKPVQPNTPSGNDAETKKPQSKEDLLDMFNSGAQKSGGYDQVDVDDTQTKPSAPDNNHTHEHSDTNNVIRYRTLKVSRWTRFRNWLGKHWLLLGTLVAAGALVTTALLGPGLATAVVVGRAALYNILTLGTVVVAANTFKYFFFRRHRQVGIDQGHFLRREAKVDKKLLSIDRTRSKISDLESKLTSCLTNPTRNAGKIKDICKQIAKYNKQLKKETTFVCRELEGTANQRGFLKNVGKVLRIVVGKAPLVYYQERHNKHMDILQEKSSNKKYSELRLDGNIADEMFQWHLIRRKIIEDAKVTTAKANNDIANINRQINNLGSDAKKGSTVSVLESVRKILENNRDNTQSVSDSVRLVDPCSAEYGPAAKDIVKNNESIPQYQSRRNQPTEVVIDVAANQKTGDYHGGTTVITKTYHSNKKSANPVNISGLGSKENQQKLIAQETQDQGMSK